MHRIVVHIFFISLFLSLNLSAITNFFENNSTIKEAKNEKIALLTFDDGPIRATKNILKVVKEESIPVTMFFIGYQVENANNIYKKVLKESNITIANHTYSHANNRYREFYSNPTSVLEDIKKSNSLMSKNEKSILPVRLAGRNVFRLPEIKVNDFAISKEQTNIETVAYDDIFNEGFHIYGWDLEWEYDVDGEPKQTPEQIFYSMEKIYKSKLTIKENKVILLMHDIMFSSHFEGEENLKTLITLLKNSGWSFESIENY
ncbi:hypothetical protein CRU92_10075 [Arcobacter sp. FW59]|nr:hypothetical protein CRU92_10075 [Arcobacter sp. FW59]